MVSNLSGYFQDSCAKQKSGSAHFIRTAAQSRNFHISTSDKNPPKPGISVGGDLCSSF
ncbi:hypothetical protein HMPREF9104_00873 [Lentilactobacillus kisonensis F0435]|uniref:Uncharacterized protein n=1 Tax=Lentilactobacillus kisonensis F0435 TaxID=797516 RepID=H1LE47_9LACO|nr:hypothetical protein HMPREF9104_00873 [Lentilactobacillus kisonensis F0435]